MGANSMPLIKILFKNGAYTKATTHFDYNLLAKNLSRSDTWVVNFEIINEKLTESHIAKLQDALKNNKMVTRIAFKGCHITANEQTKLKNLVALKRKTEAILGFPIYSDVSSVTNINEILPTLFEGRNFTLQQINFDGEIYSLGLEVNKVLATHKATSAKHINQNTINELNSVFANHCIHLATQGRVKQNQKFRYLKLAEKYFYSITTLNYSHRNNYINCLKLLIDKQKVMLAAPYEYLIKMYKVLKEIPAAELTTEDNANLKMCLEQLIQIYPKKDKKTELQIELYDLYSLQPEDERMTSDWRNLFNLASDIVASNKTCAQTKYAKAALNYFCNIKDKSALDWQTLEISTWPLRTFEYLWEAKSSLPALLSLCFTKLDNTSELDECKILNDMIDAEIYQPKHHKIRNYYQHLINAALTLFSTNNLPDSLLKNSLEKNLEPFKTTLENLKNIDSDKIQKENDALRKLNLAYEEQTKVLEGMISVLTDTITPANTITAGSPSKWVPKKQSVTQFSFLDKPKNKPKHNNANKKPKTESRPKPN